MNRKKLFMLESRRLTSIASSLDWMPPWQQGRNCSLWPRKWESKCHWVLAAVCHDPRAVDHGHWSDGCVGQCTGQCPPALPHWPLGKHIGKPLPFGRTGAGKLSQKNQMKHINMILIVDVLEINECFQLSVQQFHVLNIIFGRYTTVTCLLVVFLF